MRKLSILYGLVLESLLSDRTEKNNGGICGEINFLRDRGYKITEREVNKLKTHFEKQNPIINKNNAEWINHELYIDRAFWFFEMKSFEGVLNPSAV